MNQKRLFGVIAAAAFAGFLFAGFRLAQRLPKAPLPPPPEAALLPDAASPSLSPEDQKTLLLYELSKGESTEAVFTLSENAEDLKILKAAYLEAEGILRAGKPPSSLPEDLRTLYNKVQEYRRQTVRRLLEEGARAHSKDKIFGWTPLHWAAARGERELLVLLLDRGAEVNAKDNNLWTPLHEAISNKDTETAAFLLDRGADVNAADKNGRTPLHDAAADGEREISALLLERGANVNQKDKTGRSPLGHAKQSEDSKAEALFSKHNIFLKLKRLIFIALFAAIAGLAVILLKS